MTITFQRELKKGKVNQTLPKPLFSCVRKKKTWERPRLHLVLLHFQAAFFWNKLVVRISVLAVWIASPITSTLKCQVNTKSPECFSQIKKIRCIQYCYYVLGYNYFVPKSMNIQTISNHKLVWVAILLILHIKLVT